MHFMLKRAHYIGVVIAVWYLICIAWFYIQPAERILHEQLFRLSFLFFTDMHNPLSLLLGLIQSYIWGYIAVGVMAITSKIARS